jgi:hypothetical protein
MWFPMPALRTHTITVWPSPGSSAHAATPLSAATLPTACLSPPTSSSPAPTHSPVSSVHGVFPLAASVPIFKVPAASSPAGAGHGEGSFFEHTGEPSLDDFLQVACHERDHPDPIGSDHSLHRTGNRTADEDVNAQFGQAEPPPRSRIVRQGRFGLVDHPPRLRLHEVDLPGYIKDRRDSVVPDCKCRLRHPGSSAASLHIRESKSCASGGTVRFSARNLLIQVDLLRLQPRRQAAVESLLCDSIAENRLHECYSFWRRLERPSIFVGEIPSFFSFRNRVLL